MSSRDLGLRGAWRLLSCGRGLKGLSIRCRCLAGSPPSTSSYPEPSRVYLFYLQDNAGLLSNHTVVCPESA